MGVSVPQLPYLPRAQGYTPGGVGEGLVHQKASFGDTMVDSNRVFWFRKDSLSCISMDNLETNMQLESHFRS